jgi:hypothetical protein
LKMAFLHFYTWCKRLMAKLPKLLPHRGEPEEEADPAPGVLTELDKQLGREIKERQAKMSRPIDTSRGDPNMPRYQRCICGRWAKRTDKAEVGGKPGAFYKCSIHGEFFVSRRV